MESTPFINIIAVRLPPAEEERYLRWLYEVYYPLMMRFHLCQGVDRYTIVKENADYPEKISTYHYLEFKEWVAHYSSPVMLDILKDVQTTFHREYVWTGVYQLIWSFHSPVSSEQTAFVNDTPIMHMAGFKLSIEKEEFNAWFKEWGAKVYLPILMKLSGLKAVNFYSFTGRSSQPEAKDPNYPNLLSLWYFDTLKSFQNYAESPELAAFMKALKSDFPGGIALRWYVQYELFKSFRR